MNGEFVLLKGAELAEGPTTKSAHQKRRFTGYQTSVEIDSSLVGIGETASSAFE